MAARSPAKRFLAAALFWRLWITLAPGVGNRTFGRSDFAGEWPRSGQLFLPLAVGLAGFAMLGPAAICSTVSPVGFPSGFLPESSPLPFDGRLSARFAAEDLRGMAERKSTMARLPQAPAWQRTELRDLRSCRRMIRLGSGQAGGCPVSQVSLAKLVTSQRGAFSNLETTSF
jgi:hypothetical protein